MRHHLAEQGLQGSCACSCIFVSTISVALSLTFLHEGPAEERDKDHRQPRGHLGEAPGNVCEWDGKVVLLEQTIEGVERTLVRGDLVNLVVNNKLLEGLGGSRGAVQGLVAVLRNRRRLVGQRLGNAELDQRWRADRP